MLFVYLKLFALSISIDLFLSIKTYLFNINCFAESELSISFVTCILGSLFRSELPLVTAIHFVESHRSSKN